MLKSICILVSFVVLGTSVQATVLETIEIKESPSESVGFLGVSSSLKEAPVSVKAVSAQQISENQIHRLTDVTEVEAAMTESYSGVGYWDSVSLRGYKLDPRTSYLRDGLPISGETAIALENKEGIDVLKGFGAVSSAANVPGGLINYQTKKSTGQQRRDIYTSFNDQAGFKIHGDVDAAILSDVSVRTNLAHEQLRPGIENTKGERSLAAVALLWALRQDLVFETELEWSMQRQPTQAGFSLLGTEVPQPFSKVNLNNQAWTLPVRFEGLTGSAKVTKSFSSYESIYIQAGFQNLKTDDHVAYPFGCSAENTYDRFCSDGSFDIYDFRSEGEKRDRHFAKIAYQNQINLKAVTYNFEVGAQLLKARESANMQAYNLVGQGSIDASVQVPENPATLDQGTSRSYGSSELYISNQFSWDAWKLWLSARHTQLHRESHRTDGSRAINYDQSIWAPWMALSYDFDSLVTYLSYAEGTESFVTPNRNSYANPGQYLTNVRSQQWELGAKSKALPISAAVFSIARPLVYDSAPTYQVDGEAVHQGLEIQAEHQHGPVQGSVSAMFLNAKQQGRTLSTTNEERPVNVPGFTLRTQMHYFFIPERFSGGIFWSHEGDRTVLADGGVKIPSWNRFDLMTTYKANLAGYKTQAQVRLENVLDSRYWKESPTQYGHIYLYPSPPRQLWLQVQVDL